MSEWFSWFIFRFLFEAPLSECSIPCPYEIANRWDTVQSLQYRVDKTCTIHVFEQNERVIAGEIGAKAFVDGGHSNKIAILHDICR